MSQAPPNPIPPVAAPAPPAPPAPSPLDRTPAVAPPNTTPQVWKYLEPGDITAALQSSPDNVYWVCRPAEKYAYLGGLLKAKNITLDLNQSTLQCTHKPGDGNALGIAGDYFSLLNGTVVGDGGTAVHVTTAKGCNFADLTVFKANIFIINDPTAISTTVARIKQGDNSTGGQMTGADEDVLEVANVTFDADPIYPNISTQSGVRFKVNNCRFRGGGQPIGVGNGSTLQSADSNTVVLPNSRSLIFHQNGQKEDGTNTRRVAG